MNIITKKQLKNIYKIGILVIMITILTASSFIEDKKTTQTTSSNNVSNNKKIGWGISRNKTHEQPDVGKENREILEKNNGICLGNKDKKYLYLTFDEGYEAGYTSKILDTLKENKVSATFFITAHYVNTEPELVERMIKEGHIVGNHTVNHKCLPEISDEEIKKEVMQLHQAIYEKFNYEMKYIRPPKGEFSERSLQTTNSLGYKNVMWSFAYQDWNEKKQPSEEEAKRKIIENFHNGEIILLHGNSKTNTNVLDTIIKEARNMGYEFKSLDQFEN